MHPRSIKRSGCQFLVSPKPKRGTSLLPSFVLQAKVLRKAALFILTLTALGCSNSRKATTVTGKVTYQGNPVSVGAIYFHSKDNQVAMGNLNPDGTFTATDVPLGEVRVSLQVRDPGAYSKEMEARSKDPMAGLTAPVRVGKIPPKYADPDTSGLKYVIDSSTNDLVVELN